MPVPGVFHRLFGRMFDSIACSLPIRAILLITVLAATGLGQSVPTPQIVSLTPASVTAGNPGFTLLINGANLGGPNAGVILGGSGLGAGPTSTGQQLVVLVPAKVLTTPGSFNVIVQLNLGNVVLTSNIAVFSILPAPTVASLSPASHTAGGPAFTLTVNGTGFQKGMTGNWNGSPRNTTVVSATQLTADIPATDIGSATVANVTVVTIDGVSSNAGLFSVNAAPIITSLSPAARTAGAAAFALTVNGAGFVNGVAVNWNGSARPTTLVNANQLTAAIPAADIATVNGAKVTVVTADGVSSNSAGFSVSAAPAVTGLSPNTHTAGSAAFPLTVNGVGFVSGMAVNWNGSARATTFVSATQLTAAIPATDVASATSAAVTVVSVDGVSSNSAAFNVTAAPVLNSLSPPSRTATSPAFSLTVNGVNLVNGMTVQWNGANLPTTFVNPGQLTATVAAALVASAGTAQLTVVTQDGISSGPIPFPITPAPTLSSLSPAAATAGSAAFTLTVTGANFASGGQAAGPSQIVFGSSALPTTFGSVSSLSATVPANLVTTAGPLNVSVVSPGGAVSNNLVFTVNPPLVITSGPPVAATAGVPFVGKNTASGGTPPLVWAASGLPAGLAINPATGDITGTPNATGTFTITVTVTDASSQTATARYTGVAGPPPVQIVTGSTLPTGTVGVAYLAAFGASGGTSNYTWSLGAGNLPDGLSFTSNGFISGTPTKAGQFSFTVIVTDSAGSTANKGFTLVIQPAPLVLSGSVPADTGIGAPLSIKFGATGGVPPYRFGVSGSIPIGTSFSVDGTLSGTPTAPGSFGFVVSVTDATGIVATKGFSITVSALSLALTPAALSDAQVGVSYSAKVGATGGTPPYLFSATGTPAGLSFSSSGTLSGTPTLEGQASLAVTVTDAAGGKAAGSFSLTVKPPGLTVSTASLPNGTVNSTYSASLTASGGLQPYTWSVSGTPDGLSGSADGSISGTPKSAGSFNISVTVKDAAGSTATQSFSITIALASLVITPPANNGTVGVAFSASASASGGVPPYTFSATGLPAGVTIASGTGALTGTPNAPGTSQVTITLKDSTGATASITFQLTIGLPATPDVSINGISDTAVPGTQQSAQIALQTSYPLDVTVTLTLTFAPDAGPDDPAIQFSSGGRTARVVVPAGATTSATSVGLQPGTVAGNITVTAQLQAGTADISPTPAPKRVIRINPAAPVATTVTATRNSSGFTVVMTGFVTDREITQAIFAFAAGSGANLQTTQITIPADAMFAQWYSSSAAAAFGSQFTMTQPFTVQGNQQAITAITATLVNKVGASQPVTVTLQ